MTLGRNALFICFYESLEEEKCISNAENDIKRTIKEGTNGTKRGGKTRQSSKMRVLYRFNRHLIEHR